MNKAIFDKYTITVGDLIQAFACSMCRHDGDKPCKYLPESNKEFCKHYERDELSKVILEKQENDSCDSTW